MYKVLIDTRIVYLTFSWGSYVESEYTDGGYYRYGFFVSINRNWSFESIVEKYVKE